VIRMRQSAINASLNRAFHEELRVEVHFRSPVAMGEDPTEYTVVHGIIKKGPHNAPEPSEPDYMYEAFQIQTEEDPENLWQLSTDTIRAIIVEPT
jgi:hypothetical protein